MKLTMKLLHNGAVAQSFTWKRNGSLHLDLPSKVLPCRGMGPHSVAEFVRGRGQRNLERTLRRNILKRESFCEVWRRSGVLPSRDKKLLGVTMITDRTCVDARYSTGS